MEEGVVRSRFGHFRSFLEVCVVVFATHVVPFFDKSHFLITVAWITIQYFCCTKVCLVPYFLCSRTQSVHSRPRGWQLPSTGGREHTHTHTPSVEGGAAAAQSRRLPPLPIQEALGNTRTNGIFVPCHGGDGHQIRDPTPVIVVGEEALRDMSSSSSLLMASIGDCNFCLFPEDLRPP